jgi:hypothetical protein
MGMRPRSVLVSFVLAQALLLGPTFGQGDPIETYLASAEKKAASVVNNAGAQGRGVAMEAGQAALNAIAAFRAAYGDSLNLTENMLTGQQAELFRNIHSAIDRLDAYTRDATTNLQGVANTLAAAVTALPFSNDIPRVTVIAPLYIIEGESRELVLRGIGLSNGDPVLETPAGNLRPSTETDSEIRFTLPTLSAKPNNRPASFATTLRLFERKSKFFFFSTYIPHTYPVTVAIYPREVGKIKITPRRKVASTESRQQTTSEYRCDSPRGEGSHSVPANVVPSPGWSIETSSIRYNRTYSNHGSFTMNTTSPAGFTATLSCSGWGRVVALGIVVDQGSIGVEKGYFTFTESRPIETLQNGDEQTAILHWGDALTFSNLPNDTETVLVELTPFTGQSLSFEGAGRNRFMNIAFSQATRVATLTARGIEEVLRQ